MKLRFGKKFLDNSRSESGVALPSALLVGVLVTGIGLAMITRSSSDRSKAVTKQASARALGISEVAITRIKTLIDKNRLLSMYSMNDWASLNPQATTDAGKSSFQLDLEYEIEKELTDNNSCNPDTRTRRDSASIREEIRDRLEIIKSIATDYTSDTWQTLPDGQGSYRLVAYHYQGTPGRVNGTQKGFLTVDGKAGKDNTKSIGRVNVEMPVIQQPSDSLFTGARIPGLWIEEGATNDGTSILQRIDLNTGIYTGGSTFNANVAMSDRCSFTLELQAKLADFITTARITGTDGYRAKFVSEQFPDLPPIPTNLPASQTNLTLTASETFPRSEDIPTRKITLGGQSVDVYEYIINSINLSGNSAITITPGSRVIFYVRGNIGGNGNGGIEHDCSRAPVGTLCGSTNLQIFAYHTSNSTLPEICLRGNARLDAFIFAPDYPIGKTGNGDFFGSVWAKSWGKIQNCGSNNTKVAIVQQGEWTALYHDLRPDTPLPKIGSAIAWSQIATDSAITPPSPITSPSPTVNPLPSPTVNPLPLPTVSPLPVKNCRNRNRC